MKCPKCGKVDPVIEHYRQRVSYTIYRCPKCMRQLREVTHKREGK